MSKTRDNQNTTFALTGSDWRGREHTVYQCGECDTRYLAEQWCPDCARPCRSLGPGGECGHCAEPLTIQELLTGEVLT